LRIFVQLTDTNSILGTMYLFNFHLLSRLMFFIFYFFYFQLLKEVLNYLDEWKATVDMIEGISKEEKQRFCISEETYIGWYISSKNNF